jgi:hypothetical protein
MEARSIRTGGRAARSVQGLIVAICLGGLAAMLVTPAIASAYNFGEPFVRQVGTDTVVFDWSTQKCEDNDITDEPARAFRDDSGQVQLVTSHFVNRRFIGPNLDSLTHPCTKTMSSTGNSDPAMYDGREWVASPWTPDGKNIYALVHNEYSGHLYSPGGYCLFSGESQSDRYKCWYNSVTSAYSTNSGATYQQLPAPSHLVATIPYQYAKDGPNGYFAPSNIVRSGDGYFYAFIRAEDKGFQQLGSCLLRTRNLSDPTAWRAWNGSGFTFAFQNPYVGTFDPAQHVCAPVDLPHIGNVTESLTYNTYLHKWMLVGGSVGAAEYNRPPGFYYALSDDLVNWTNLELLMETELTYARDCVNPPYPLRDPSLIDPNSTSRNFETVGQNAYLFYTEFHNSGCNAILDRDLRRIPVEFSNQVAGGPSAALTASTSSASVGDSVQFDASGSTDSDGTVRSYQWDLDGDGTFERNTGTAPATSKTYTAPEQVTVTVRVSDNDGKSTDETEIVKVTGNSPSPAVCRQITWKKKRACRSAR